jgi:molecular chaperone GrpE
MTERFDLNQSPEPVPPAAVEADPVQAMRSLYARIARLERALEREQERREQERQETGRTIQETLCAVLEVYDYMTETVERFGVTTNAQESALVRRSLDLASLIRESFARQGIEPIETLGKPMDESATVVEDVEVNTSVPAGTVLREVQVGYRWPLGVIRPARVIVAAAEPVESPADVSPDDQVDEDDATASPDEDA